MSALSRRGRLSVSLALLLTFAPLLAGDAQSWKLASAGSTGSKRLGSAEIGAASGLRPGATVTVADLTRAADRLAQTGVFTSVAFQYQHEGGELSVIFTVKDIEPQFPIRFENFVWAEDKELERYLEENVPLFHGHVPTIGARVEVVAAALTMWLSAHGLPGTARAAIHDGGLGAPGGELKIDAAGFMVDGVPMTVGAVELENAPSLTAEERAQLTKALVGTRYYRARIFEDMSNRLHAIYAAKGMIQAHMAMPRLRSIGANPAAPDLTLVCAVDEGRAYKVSGIVWKRPVPEELTRSIQVQTGALADIDKLNRQLEAVHKLLAPQGYLNARVSSDYRLHDDDSTVEYVVDVDPGPLYRLGTVQFQSPMEEVRRRLEKRWKMQPGDVFDPGYFDRFVQENMGSLAGHTLTKRQTEADGNRVNLTIELR